MSIESTLTAIADAIKNGSQAIIGLSASIDRYCDIIERHPPADGVAAEASLEPETSAPKVETAETAETAPVETEEAYTYEEHVKPATLDAVKALGKDVVLEKMNEMFGVKKAPEIPAERYGDWLRALAQLEEA